MATPDTFARRIHADVVAALELPTEDQRSLRLEEIAEELFTAAYDQQVTDDTPTDFSEADVRRFVVPLTAAINMTDSDSSSDLVSGWIATAAYNAATIATAPAGASLTWRTQLDPRVRDMHVPMEGAMVSGGKPFNVGGHPLLYPGQPIGPPEVWINCRCYLDVTSSALSPLTADGSDAPKGAVIVALPRDPGSLAVSGGDPPEELHVTLGYYPGEMVAADDGTLRAALEDYIRTQSISDPSVRVGGRAVMGDDDPPATTLLLESDELERLRAALLAVAPPDTKHPHFTPHLTLGYGIPVPEESQGNFELADIELWWQDERISRDDLGEAAPMTAAISEEPWSNWSAADYSIEQWRKACLITMPDGDPESKSTYKLPVRTPGGAINRAGVHAAAAALAGARGGVDAPADQKAKARAKLRGLYRTIGDDPPDSIKSSADLLAAFAEDASVVAAPRGVPTPANTHDGPGWLTHPRDTQRLRDYWTRGTGAAKIRWGSPGDLTRCKSQLQKYVGPYAWGTCQNLHHVVFGFFNPESKGHGRRGSLEDAEAALLEPITAAFDAAANLEDAMLPPLDLFTDPKLDGPTPMTMRAAGDFTEYVGHLASWDTCHVGMEGSCVTAPKSLAAYAYFRTGEVETEGGPVAVGHITAGTGHAATNLAAAETVRHYDDTGTVVADVAAGEDEFGIWAHGIVRPGIAEEQAYALRAGAPSGDWRRIGGNLELVGALIVNVPGFPIPRPELAASGGRDLALVAAAIVTVDPNAALAERVAVTLLRTMDQRDAARDRAQRAGVVLASLREDRVDALMALMSAMDEDPCGERRIGESVDDYKQRLAVCLEERSAAVEPVPA